MGHAGQIQTDRESFPGSEFGHGAGTALVFLAGALYCALPLDQIIETMRPLPVQPLAGTGSTVLGICVMRGTPTPVVDVAGVLGGHTATVCRFVAVRTDRGPVALATGKVFGIQPVDTTVATGRQASLLSEAPTGLIAGVGTFRGEPLLVLRDLGVLSDEIWAATAARVAES
jgi:purine-binding chemotaxis protein CheW